MVRTNMHVEEGIKRETEEEGEGLSLKFSLILTFYDVKLVSELVVTQQMLNQTIKHMDET